MGSMRRKPPPRACSACIPAELSWSTCRRSPANGGALANIRTPRSETTLDVRPQRHGAPGRAAQLRRDRRSSEALLRGTVRLLLRRRQLLRPMRRYVGPHHVAPCLEAGRGMRMSTESSVSGTTRRAATGFRCLALSNFTCTRSGRSPRGTATRVLRRGYTRHDCSTCSTRPGWSPSATSTGCGLRRGFEQEAGT